MQILLLKAVLFVLALSLDTLIASLTLGAQKITLPFCSIMGMSVVCSAGLMVSMLAGEKAGQWFSGKTSVLLGSFLLMGLGCLRLCSEAFKKGIHRLCGRTEGMVLHISGFTVFLTVCVDPAKADFNGSKSLSLWEAVSLAGALSLDGVTAGLGAGMLGSSPFLVGGISLAVNFLAAKLGWKFGRKLSQRFHQNLSFAAGLVLIGLGAAKLFGLRSN